MVYRVNKILLATGFITDLSTYVGYIQAMLSFSSVYQIYK